ncbi:MAG: HigA family addiction module antidote protein [Candidatus Aminicenantes bacterium]|nr:HigA family addiction module antidote protein [Candidatus Aminicenantes bacterium]
MFEIVERPTLPGEILLEEFMKPLGISRNSLAVHLGVSYSRINEIIQGRRAITTDTAFRLAAYFDTTPEFWLNARNAVDMFDTLQDHKIDYQKIRRDSHVSQVAAI